MGTFQHSTFGGLVGRCLHVGLWCLRVSSLTRSMRIVLRLSRMPCLNCSRKMVWISLPMPLIRISRTLPFMILWRRISVTASSCSLENSLLSARRTCSLARLHHLRTNSRMAVSSSGRARMTNVFLEKPGS